MTDNRDEVRVLHSQATEQTSDTATERVLTAQQGVSAHSYDTGTTANAASIGRDGEVGRLQLLEERAVVNVQRTGAGQVQIRKVLHERQEMVPVTITSEVLEITVNSAPAAGAVGAQQGETLAQQGVSEILIDGQPLQIGQTYTIPLTEERYQVVKQVFPISDVVVRKRTKTETHQETVTLRHEELDVKADEGLAQTVEVQDGVRR